MPTPAPKTQPSFSDCDFAKQLHDHQVALNLNHQFRDAISPEAATKEREMVLGSLRVLVGRAVKANLDNVVWRVTAEMNTPGSLADDKDLAEFWIGATDDIAMAREALDARKRHNEYLAASREEARAKTAAAMIPALKLAHEARVGGLEA